MAAMNKDEHLKRHLDLCQQVYERMKREGTWPWPELSDSPNFGDVVDLRDTNDDA